MAAIVKPRGHMFFCWPSGEIVVEWLLHSAVAQVPLLRLRLRLRLQLRRSCANAHNRVESSTLRAPQA